MKTVSILGATGSVGKSTIDVILSARDKFQVRAVTAQNNVASLAQIAIKLNASHAVIGNEAHYAELKNALSGSGIKASAGTNAINDAASLPSDLTICAIVGMAGLRPLLRAINQGKSVAIANKEPLVAAGKLVMQLAKEKGATILPLDSEHNAIFQIYDKSGDINNITLTASGGPFWGWNKRDIAAATPEQALKHPTWNMGRKISIDSATMINKALEVIEAHHLFNLPKEKIKVLVHPQSVVHGMVNFIDGSVLAHMASSDMRTPIAHVLAWPKRMKTCGKTLGIEDLTKLEFFSPDDNKFPSLPLAYKCLDSGHASCIALNAANEVAVDAFLENRLAFGDIIACIENALETVCDSKVDTLEEIEDIDLKAREITKEYINGNS